MFWYPDGQDRVQFKGVLSEEGIARFLIKNLGDTILVNKFFHYKFKVVESTILSNDLIKKHYLRDEKLRD